MPDDAASRPLDRLVIGAGLQGLRRGLLARRAGERVLVLEAQPRPGGEVRTLRTEGFRCELGPFAFEEAELSALTEALDSPPPTVSLLPGARHGSLFDGAALRETPVAGDPRTGGAGCEDLVHAMRRELGPGLRLGRAVEELHPVDEDRWTAVLGGEVPAELRAPEVDLCIPLVAAARLLAPLDPRLAGSAEHLRVEPAAFVFLGSWQDRHSEAAFRGYGVLRDPPGEGLREAIFATNCFPGCAVAGKALVRIEVGPALISSTTDTPGARDDEALCEAAEQQLREITGFAGTTLFRRAHRFSQPVIDGAHAECRVRLEALCARTTGLRWQPG